MALYLRIDINIISMILLSIIILIALDRLDRTDKLNKYFFHTSLVIILQLFIETMTCIINKRPEKWLIPFTELFHICLFITAPLLTYLWCIFIYQWIINAEKTSKRMKWLSIPFIINIILVILTPFKGYIFTISSMNIYQRGPLFIISAIITYSYILIGLFILIFNKKNIIKEDHIPFCALGIFPVVGGILQTFFYPILSMWSSIAFSFVIIYIFLQQRMFYVDKLTGAWTRGSFDNYIHEKKRQRNRENFGVIFIDLDGLKSINDKYGHMEGDIVLKTVVKLVKSSLRKTDIVARFGGDEFIIVLESITEEGFKKVIGKIDNCFDQYNKTSGKGYRIEYSYGYEIYNYNRYSIEEFLIHVDSLMYKDKKMKKAQKLFPEHA